MRLFPVALVLSLAAVGYADIITLKNGRIINGTYLGGTARQIKVEVGDSIQTLDLGDVARIEFNSGGAGSAASRDTAPRDDGRPTLRRPDSASSSSAPTGYGSGSGASSSRPVILQPDPNDAGSYPSSSSGSSLPTDDSRPTLKRSPSASSTDSSSSSSSDDPGRPTLKRAPDSSSTDSSSSSDDPGRPTLKRAPDSSSTDSSSSSDDPGRPVLRRATPDPSATTPAQAPAAPAPAAQAAAKAPAPPPPPPVSIKVGQKQDDVVAALGQPDSVSAEGNKQIYVYSSRNMKITFVNGKVSKVE